jgi:anti-sigma B factor antagonist
VEIVETTEDGFTVLEVRGRINSTTASGLQERLFAAAQGGHPGVVVDLKQVAYISSAGFRALLLGARAGSNSGCGLALCGATGEVQRLFDISGFDSAFDMFGTRSECIARLRSGSRKGDTE